MNLKPMLNAYPDSLGRNAGDIVTLLGRNELKQVFGSFTFCQACIIQI